MDSESVGEDEYKRGAKPPKLRKHQLRFAILQPVTRSQHNPWVLARDGPTPGCPTDSTEPHAT
eukprot:2391698-Alexandrium_andersonii.AAC.1